MKTNKETHKKEKREGFVAIPLPLILKQNRGGKYIERVFMLIESERLRQRKETSSFDFEVEELKEILEAPYQRTHDLRVKILDPCVEGINMRTDLDVTLEPVYTRRKISAFRFAIQEKSN